MRETDSSRISKGMPRLCSYRYIFHFC